MENTTIATIDYSKKVLEDLFRPYATELVKFSDSATIIKIDDDNKLATAKANVKKVTDIKSAVEELHKIKKKPALLFSKAIDAEKKKIDEEADRIISTLKTRITSYQEVQQAAANAEAIRKSEELEKKTRKIAEEKNDIVRMTYKMDAMIKGGTYLDPNGTPRSVTAPRNEEEYNNVRNIFLNNLPKKESFSEELRDHWTQIVSEMISLIDKKIEALKIPPLPDDEENLREEKSSIVVTLSQMESSIDKSIKKEEKAIVSEVKSAGKGLIVSLQFNIVDQAQVPAIFLQVSQEKVNEYLRQNKQSILEQLKNGVGNYDIIKGLHVTAVNSVRVS
jgi:hypothetical protein